MGEIKAMTATDVDDVVRRYEVALSCYVYCVYIEALKICFGKNSEAYAVGVTAVSARLWYPPPPPPQGVDRFLVTVNKPQSSGVRPNRYMLKGHEIYSHKTL